jgi:hypothetical protein
MNKYDNWRGKRMVDCGLLLIDDYVDVRDTESIWCQGQVK